MSKTFTSMTALINEIENRMVKAVDMTKEEVFNTLQIFMAAHYGEYEPKMYARTYAMFNSIVQIGANRIGTTVSAEVKIDDGYLGTNYPTGTIMPSGQAVLEAAEGGFHGVDRNVKGSVRPWTDAINSLGGISGIEQILIKNLKACGL